MTSDEIVVGRWPSADAHAVAGEPVREIRPDGEGQDDSEGGDEEAADA